MVESEIESICLGHVRKEGQTASFFYPRARGLVVMIVACQVMDPGSIPGERIFLSFFDPPNLIVCQPEL